MRVTERLIRDTNQKNKRKAAPPSEEEEETTTYALQKRQVPLNHQKGVFHQGTFEGINTKKSVFDETAVFFVEERKE